MLEEKAMSDLRFFLIWFLSSITTNPAFYDIITCKPFPIHSCGGVATDSCGYFCIGKLEK